MSDTLGELGEFEVIRRLMALSPGATALDSRAALDRAGSPGLVLGAGDDAALIRPRPGYDLAVTTDTFVEGTHFRREWIDAASLGARFAAANLSDLAAMAAGPRWALVSFGARREHDAADLVAIQRGLVTALARHGAVIAGGNLAAVEGNEWMTLTLLGEVRAPVAWTRAGARAGQLIAVTGFPGRAGAAVALARRDATAIDDPRWRELFTAWRTPNVRVELAAALAEAGGISAAIDISDGLSSDLSRLCAASGVGARLTGESLLTDPLLEGAARELGVPPDRLRFGASDDYELVLIVDPSRREACRDIASRQRVPLAFVGVVTETQGVFLEASGGRTVPIANEGYDHFGPGPG